MVGERNMKYLYKYCWWGEKAKKIILNNELHFANPKLFNDPFDCRIAVKIEGTEEAFLKVLEQNKAQMIKEMVAQEPGLGISEAEKVINEEIKKNYNNPAFREMVSMHQVESMCRGIGVSCFTSENDNLLMWAHYANSHKGICFEFKAGERFFGAAQQVMYQDNIPEINYFSGPEEWMKCILTKSNHWKYERESRIVMPGANDKYTPFPAELLTGVIMGSQVDMETKNEVITLLKKRQTSVKLYQAIVKHDTFGLDIKEVMTI
jgi:hypothetical protein